MADHDNEIDKTRAHHWLLGALVLVALGLLAPILRLLQLAGIA